MKFNYILSLILVGIIIIQILFTYINGSQFTNAERINCPNIMSSCWGYGVSKESFRSVNIIDNSCEISQYWRHSVIHIPIFGFLIIALIIIFYIQLKDTDLLSFFKGIIDEQRDEDKRSIDILSIITVISFIISFIIGGDISFISLLALIFCVISIIYQVI